MHLNDVHFGYRAHTEVVCGVSAELSAGRVTALVGPNAAGKSTLLRLMLGHLKPRRGQVMLDGESVWAMSACQRAARLAYVPQRTMAEVALTVEQVVALGRFALPVDDEAVAQALSVCGLSDLRDEVFSRLSAGQQQRVALARAVAQVSQVSHVSSPDSPAGRFMLLDEPVNAMDLKHVHAALALLSKLAARGLGVLIVLHDLNLTAAYAQIVWLMNEGKLVQAGPAEAVLTPAVLEPVYGVALRSQPVEGQARPMLFVQPSRTLMDEPDPGSIAHV